MPKKASVKINKINNINDLKKINQIYNIYLNEFDLNIFHPLSL